MIHTFRYSKNGFKPQFQEHLAGAIASFHELKNAIENKTIDRSTYSSQLIIKTLEGLDVDPDFILSGVFAFLYEPDDNTFNHFLNHLNKKDKPCKEKDKHSLILPNNTICYVDDGYCFCKQNKRTLKEAFMEKQLAVFIPNYNDILTC